MSKCKKLKSKRSRFSMRTDVLFRVFNIGRIGLCVSLTAAVISATIIALVASALQFEVSDIGIAAFCAFVVGLLGCDWLYYRFFPTRRDRNYVSLLIRSRGPWLYDRVLTEVRRSTRPIGTSYSVKITDPAFLQGAEALTSPQIAFAIKSGRFDAYEVSVLRCMLIFIDRIGHNIGHQAVPMGNHVGTAPYYAISRSELLDCSI